MRAGCVALAFLVACGGHYGGKPTTAKRPSSDPKGGGIERAALPYAIVDGRTGRQIDTEQFWQKLGTARVVCVGEDHNNPHHHWVQLEVMSQLARHVKGRKLALGMEMFQRPFQGLLDDYAAHRIDEPTLLSRSGWDDRWGYDYGFYGPTIRAAVAAGAALLALNAPRELTKAVSHKGIAGLAPDEKAQLPELNLEDTTHRAWFDSLMEGMGGTSGHSTKKTDDADKKDDKDAKDEEPAMPPGHPAMPSADNIYAAQVVWDESMADGAATWAKANASGELVLLAGNGHCHDSAIVNRVKRRGVAEVVSVRPVLDTEGNVAEALARPMNDFLVVLQLPPASE